MVTTDKMFKKKNTKQTQNVSMLLMWCNPIIIIIIIFNYNCDVSSLYLHGPCHLLEYSYFLIILLCLGHTKVSKVFDDQGMRLNSQRSFWCIYEEQLRSLAFSAFKETPGAFHYTFVLPGIYFKRVLKKS